MSDTRGERIHLLYFLPFLPGRHLFVTILFFIVEVPPSSKETTLKIKNLVLFLLEKALIGLGKIENILQSCTPAPYPLRLYPFLFGFEEG